MKYVEGGGVAKYEVGEVITFHVHRGEVNFDRACDAARARASMLFDVDECGHINGVAGAERSNCTIEVWFDTMLMYGGMTGWEHVYRFKTRVTQSEEDE